MCYNESLLASISAIVHSLFTIFTYIARRKRFSTKTYHLLVLIILGFNKCTITIIVETDETYSTLHMPSSLMVMDCHINYLYLVSHKLSYEEDDLAKDENISEYYIVRSNYQDHGYLPFILSLLRTSTYTMIIRDGYFEHEYPDGAWMEQAILKLQKSSNKDIATCHVDVMQDHTNNHIPRGCLFFSSIHLRALITKTEFRRNNYDPFIYLYHGFLCKFQSKLHVIPCPFYQPLVEKRSWFSFLFRPAPRYQPFSFEDMTLNTCEDKLQLRDITCETTRPGDETIGVLLSQYKRTYIFDQLKSLLASSMPIADILVYQNGNHQNYQDVFKLYPSLHHIWSTNWNSPFFLRQLLPMLFQTHYHIVFDDDIIPGVDTVKTLLQTVDRYNAPSGVGGRVIQKSEYQKDTYKMFCVDCFLQEEEATPVDFVIQVYARTEYQAKVYWRYRPYTHRNGDDMHGSLSWFMECGIHARRPRFDGSSKYLNLGSDSVASYKTKTHNVVRPQTYRSWILGGYHGIMDETVRNGYPGTNKYWERKHKKSVMRYF